MNSLDRKFHHGVWHLDKELTVREFLDFAAYDDSFFIVKKVSRKQTNLMDELNYDYALANDGGPGRFKLTEERRLYFEGKRAEHRRQRKEFYTMLDEKYSIPSTLTLEQYEEIKRGLLCLLASIPRERSYEAFAAKGRLKQLINAAYFRDKIISEEEEMEAWRIFTII